MGTMASKQADEVHASNVKTETIEIKVDTSCTTAQQTPTASGFYNGSTAGASLEEAFPQRRTLNIVNTPAAALATDEKKRDNELPQGFSQIFLEYHNACVQVKSNSDETGSGILFNHSETSQVVLFTAAHVIKDSSSVKIVLETDYDYGQTENDKNVVKATQTEIALRNPEINFIDEEDAAVLLLSKEDSEKILKTVKKFPSPSRKFIDYSRVTYMMIHYAAGTNKKVSTGKSEGQGENEMLEPLKVHIEGGPGASGAPLFNSEGDVLSILRSCEEVHKELRLVVPMETISRKMIKGKKTESNQYVENIFEISEGSKAMESLWKNIDIWKEQKRKNLPMLENPVPSLKYLSELKTSCCSPILHATVLDCLAHGGKHQQTKLWSLNGEVESDHFPPYNAYKQAGRDRKCPKVVTNVLLIGDGKVRRPGENKLPAITIPTVFHRKLDTTGNSKTTKTFTKKQAEKIASGNIAGAILDNFDNYSGKGLFKRSNYHCTCSDFRLLQLKYLEEFRNALKWHEDLGFISKDERRRSERHILSLIKHDNIGEDLDENDRIIIRSQLK